MSAKTTLANLTNYEPHDVFIGRSTIWNPKMTLGNPYVIGVDGDREEVIRKFAVDFPIRMRTEPEFKELVARSEGKRLGCYCTPSACHGHVFLIYFTHGLEGVAEVAKGRSVFDVMDSDPVESPTWVHLDVDISKPMKKDKPLKQEKPQSYTQAIQSYQSATAKTDDSKMPESVPMGIPDDELPPIEAYDNVPMSAYEDEYSMRDSHDDDNHSSNGYMPDKEQAPAKTANTGTKVRFTWQRRNGYEVSSKGDTRFSPMFAKMDDGMTIEAHYQCDVKGHDPGGSDWRVGKGRPPKWPEVNLWDEYLLLWRVWSGQNIDLMRDLFKKAKANGGILSDCHASTGVNQARALATVLNELQKLSNPDPGEEPNTPVKEEPPKSGVQQELF